MYYHDKLLSIYDYFKDKFGNDDEAKQLIENVDYLLSVTVFWVEERIKKTMKERKNNFSDAFQLAESILMYLYIRVDSILIDVREICDDRIEDEHEQKSVYNDSAIKVEDAPKNQNEVLCEFCVAINELKSEAKKQLEDMLWKVREDDNTRKV
jgi:hypothetical protein